MRNKIVKCLQFIPLDLYGKTCENSVFVKITEMNDEGESIMYFSEYFLGVRICSISYNEYEQALQFFWKKINRKTKEEKGCPENNIVPP